MNDSDSSIIDKKWTKNNKSNGSNDKGSYQENENSFKRSKNTENGNSINAANWSKDSNPNFSSLDTRSFQDYRPSIKSFIPHIFKDNPSKPSMVSATDPFITAHSAKEYCSILSTEEDGLPEYLRHFKIFTDNVLNIPDHVFDDIAKVHIERENKFKEEEEEEEKRLAHQHEQELKEKSSMDKKVAKMLNVRKYYVKRCCPVKIPFKSTLSHEEHEFYIKCFIKFQIRRPVNALEEKEYEQYLSMQNRVFSEQSCLMNFSYKVSQMVLNEYNNVPVMMENYIKEYVSHRCQRASSYPSNYKNEIEIPLKSQIHNAALDNYQFTHIGHLCSMGNIPWMHIPRTFFKTTLPKDESVALKRRPDCDEDFDRSCYLYKCPVSEDPNAEYLAKLYNASVVITPSAFKTIMDNQEPFDKEWNIPVKIKTYKVKDENGKESDTRIIYIDKPLPRKTWLPLQKKYTFYKVAAKAVFTDSFKHQVNCFKLRHPYLKSKNFQPRERKNRSMSTDDNIFGNISSDESFESFGGDVSSFSSRINRRHKEKYFLPDELAKDLFLSEDEEDSRNSFEQSRNNSNQAEAVSSPLPSPSLPVKDNLSEAGSASPNSEKNITVNDGSSHSKSVDGEAESSLILNTNHKSTAFAPPSSYSPNSEKNITGIDGLSHSNSVDREAESSPNLNINHKRVEFAPPSSYEPLKRPHQKNRPPPAAAFRSPKKAKLEENTPTGLLDDLLDKQDSFLKLKTATPSASETVNTFMNTFSRPKRPPKNVGYMQPWSKTIMKWDEKYQIKECPPSGQVNVHYQLFSFANLKQCPVKEECPKPIKILVRHNVHGIAKKKNEPHRMMKAFVLFPKIENQVYFGAEVNSLSEIIQQWSDMLLRPNTQLLQVRVCTESGDVMMTEEKTLDSILKEAKQAHLNFNPQLAFSTLDILINTMRRMSSGDYLLHHSPKTEAFIKLMKAFNTNDYGFSSSLDLHKFYSDSSIASKQHRTSPWLAIDTHVLTPFHVAHHKIPATFPMENNKRLNKQERTKRRAKANKKLSIDGYH